MDEIWKDITGYEGLYQVSNLGRVKSLYDARWNIRRDKILKFGKHTGGYLKVILSKEGSYKNFFVHRLVADAFLDNRNNLPEVNHKDENKENNCVDNLEYCSRKYNINYGSHNHRSAKSRTNHPLNSKQIIQYSLDGTIVKIWPSLMEIKRELGYSHISECCNGKRKTAYGFIWKFAINNNN